MRRVRSVLAASGIAVALAVAAPANAENNSVYRSISGAGTIAFLGLGIGLPLIQDGDLGGGHSLRALDAVVSSGLLSEGISHITHQRRPNGSDFHSFPSTHATTAFAVATMQSQFHPNEAPFWYAGAALISYSRVRLHEHHWADVAAGAVLGYATARLELSSHRGILISPFYNGDEAGVQLSMKF